MGLILDSSAVIAAERRDETAERLVERVVQVSGDQETALSAVGRQTFIDDLLAGLVVYPYTKETALLAGKLDTEQRSRGVVIPYADLLIGATALSLGFSVLTANALHFRQVPGLAVVLFQ